MSNLRYGGATRISIFNHKGGVGKTTLTFNVAAALASVGKTILLVDTDPQCNLTSYLIESSVVDKWLDESDAEEGRTVWSAVKPLHDAEGGFRYVKPQGTPVEGVYLIPGDIRLSEYERDLGDFWSECFQRRMRGFRGTTALSELVSSVAEKLGIDYVFYDSGPNIGPLNRAILLDCDYFVVPVACDLFSLRALKTMGITLSAWIREWESIKALAPANTYLLSGRPAFMGYIPQGFRIYRGIVQAQSEVLGDIQKEIHSQIISRLNDIDVKLTAGNTLLGQIQDFGTLAAYSQESGLPMFEAPGGNSDLKHRAAKEFAAIAHKIEARVRRSG